MSIEISEEDERYLRTNFHRLIDDLTEGERIEFLQWALGDDYGELTFPQSPERWNKLHGNLLHIYSNGKMSQDLPKMIKIWKEACKQS